MERGAVERGEAAANHDLLDAVARLEQHRRDEAVRARAEVDGRIHRAINVQAGEAVAGDPGATREITGQHDLSVRLQRDRVHRVVQAAGDGRGEGHVRRTIGVETDHIVVRQSVVGGEETADQNLAVGLELDGAHRAVGPGTGDVERRVHRAVGIEPREVHRVGPAVDVREITGDQNLAIRLHRDRINRRVRPGAGAERAVHRAVGVEAGDEILRRAVERGEITADDHLGIRLQRHAEHGVVRAGTGVERGIHRAIDIQPHDEVAVGAVESREEAAHHHAPIGLEGDGPHRAVAAGHAVQERRVQRAIGRQPDDVIAGQVGVSGEITADEQLAVRLQRERLHEAIRPGPDREQRVHRAGRDVVGLVVEDRNLRVGQAEGRIDRQLQLEVDELVRRVRRGVVQNRHIKTRARDARQHRQRVVGRRVIDIRHCRAAQRDEIHLHCAAVAVRAHGRDRRKAAVFRDRVERRAEADGAIRIVVRDRHHAVGEAARSRPGDIGQEQVEGAIAVHQQVVNDPDGDRAAAGVTVAPREAVRRADIIHPIRRRPVQGAENRRCRADAATAARNRYGHTHAVFRHDEIGRRQADPARQEVVVHNRQRRVGQAQRRPALHVAQDQADGFIHLDQGVVDDGHGEALVRFPRGEAQRAAGGGVVRAGNRRPVGGEIVHGHYPRIAVGAIDIDRHRAGIFQHTVSRGTEEQRARQEVIIHNRQGRRALETDGRAGMHHHAATQHERVVRQRQEGEVHRLVWLGRRVVVDRDVHRGGVAAGSRRTGVVILQQPSARPQPLHRISLTHIIQAGRRITIRGCYDSINRTNPAVGALHPHQTLSAGLVDRVGRRIKLDAARPGRPTTDNSRQVAAWAELPPAKRVQLGCGQILRHYGFGSVIVRRAKAGEAATHHDIAVRLESYRGDETVRIGWSRKLVIGPVHEGRIHHAVGQQPGQVLTFRAIVVGERTSDDCLVVTLECNGADDVIGTGPRVKGEIQTTIIEQPRDPTPRPHIHCRKRPTQQYLPAGLHRQRIHGSIRAGAGTKRRIQRAILPQERDAIPAHPVDRREITAQQNLRSGRHRADRGVVGPTGRVGLPFVDHNRDGVEGKAIRRRKRNVERQREGIVRIQQQHGVGLVVDDVPVIHAQVIRDALEISRQRQRSRRGTHRDHVGVRRVAVLPPRQDQCRRRTLQR